jgi:hypothetical protein
VREAITEFELAGVTLEGIIKDGAGGAEGGRAEHPVIAAVQQLEAALACEDDTAEAQLLEKLAALDVQLGEGAWRDERGREREWTVALACEDDTAEAQLLEKLAAPDVQLGEGAHTPNRGRLSRATHCSRLTAPQSEACACGAVCARP